MTVQPSIRIENALGVCTVREDTRLLAERAGEMPGRNPVGSLVGRALDLGTGSGYVAIYLARLGWDVDAVDVSPRALTLARRNADLNGVAPRIYASDLYGSVKGPYDVIACNPPQRGNETEGSRLVTATLRRFPFLSNLLLRITQPMLERKRLGFLAELARGARPHLADGGRLLLVISPLEAAELPKLAPGLRAAGSVPVVAIPGLSVAAFVYGKGLDGDG
jgi:SAM-dependent methyltransferase